MKLNRAVLFSALITLSIFGIVCYSACLPCKCKDVICQNGGTCGCNGSTCTCPTGYSGRSCEISALALLSGTYSCHRSNCNPARDSITPWQSVFSKDSVSPQLARITNFDNTGNELQAYMMAANTLTANRSFNGYTIAMDAAVQTNQIVAHYIIHPYVTSSPDTVCDIIMVKQ